MRSVCCPCVVVSAALLCDSLLPCVLSSVILCKIFAWHTRTNGQLSSAAAQRATHTNTRKRIRTNTRLAHSHHNHVVAHRYERTQQHTRGASGANTSRGGTAHSVSCDWALLARCLTFLCGPFRSLLVAAVIQARRNVLHAASRGSERSAAHRADAAGSGGWPAFSSTKALAAVSVGNRLHACERSQAATQPTDNTVAAQRSNRCTRVQTRKVLTVKFEFCSVAGGRQAANADKKECPKCQTRVSTQHMQ